MNQIRLLHPAFFTLSSLLFLYKNAWVIASPDQLVRPLLILYVALGLFAIGTYWMTRDRDWTAIILSIIVLGFFSPNILFIITGTLTIAILFVYYASSIILKYRLELPHISKLLTLTSILLIAMIVLPHTKQFGLAFTQLPSPLLRHSFLTSMSQQPDIYYIVLDGYAREDVLTELYHLDNNRFIQFLEDNDFFVPTESRSNYPKTALSVASTLNMDYVQSFAVGLEDQPYWWRMVPFIDNSLVRAALQNIGYQSISLASDWGITNNPTTDVYFSPRAVILNDFESFILGRTPLGGIRSLISKWALVPSYDSHRGLIHFNFDTLAKLPSMPGPKFVFAHILIPHPPFIFDAEGNSLHPQYPFSFNDANDFPSSDEDYLRGYAAQLEYANRELEKLIETLLKDF